MITLDEAWARIEAEMEPLDAETVGLDAAAGRVLADPLIARRTQPPFPASAMDGYAVRSEDLPGRLKLIGESAAGRPFDGVVAARECVRISTGAPLPEGADQVVIQENAARHETWLETADTPAPDRNIRRPGIDFVEGEPLMTEGARLTPDAVSLAASAGLTRLCVRRRPRLAVLTTGDELVAPGEMPGPGQIINSVGLGIAGLARQWGCEAIELEVARDDPDEIAARLEEARAFDLLVTIGGASVGDHDHLKSVFTKAGGQLFFEKIAVKPGKPSWFGQMPKSIGQTWVTGLPGNPVSAHVMARLALRPAVQALLGGPIRPRLAPAILAEDLPETGPRETWVRAVWNRDGTALHPLSNQDSSAQSALVRSHALIRRQIGAPAIGAGTPIRALLF